MSEIETLLAPVLHHRRPPSRIAPHTVLEYECPKGLIALLSVADGFITTDRLFRIFGFGHDDQVPSIEEWNLSEWKNAYGSLAQGILFIAEDIFGDQYGYDFRSKRKFVKFYCEGGETESLEGGINWFMEALVDPFGSGALDGELLKAVRHSGSWPAANEHFAFKMPLIVGGKREVENLEVESVNLHLGVLAQISSFNLSQADGTPIARFTFEK